MLYIFLLIFIIFFTILAIIYKKRSQKQSDTLIVSPKSIEQNILIELANLEKKLYKHGFTRYSIVKINSITSKVTLFYYYNYIDNIHTFIAYYKGEFIYFIVTIYKNGKILVSPSNYQYIKKSFKVMFIYNEDSTLFDDVLQTHKSNRESINYEPAEAKLTNNEILKIYNSISKIGA